MGDDLKSNASEAITLFWSWKQGYISYWTIGYATERHLEGYRETLL